MSPREKGAYLRVRGWKTNKDVTGGRDVLCWYDPQHPLGGGLTVHEAYRIQRDRETAKPAGRS